jgi:hypothetical protein
MSKMPIFYYGAECCELLPGRLRAARCHATHTRIGLCLGKRWALKTLVYGDWSGSKQRQTASKSGLYFTMAPSVASFCRDGRRLYAAMQPAHV